MTQAKAQTVVSGAVAAGYSVSTAVDPSGGWTVYLSPASSALDLQNIATFAANQSLTGTLTQVALK